MTLYVVVPLAGLPIDQVRLYAALARCWLDILHRIRVPGIEPSRFSARVAVDFKAALGMRQHSYEVLVPFAETG